MPGVVLSTSPTVAHLNLTITLGGGQWGTGGSCDSEEVEPGSDTGHWVSVFVLLTLP